MGFNVVTYPSLPARISARVAKLDEARRDAGEQEISKSKEDTAVAEILEELLAEPTAGPSVGASGIRRMHTMR